MVLAKLLAAGYILFGLRDFYNIYIRHGAYRIAQESDNPKIFKCLFHIYAFFWIVLTAVPKCLAVCWIMLHR